MQEKVYEEIVEVSKRHDNKFTYEALQDLTYLECVLHGKIAARIFPIDSLRVFIVRVQYFLCFPSSFRITAP